MTTPLCIYHAHCPDGFAAAWVVRQALLGAVDFHPATYGDDPPDVSGRDVFIVDFSYPRATLLQMVEDAESMTILDHHATAQLAIADLPGAIVRFSSVMSGCMLAWKYFFHGQPAPKLLQHIQDRDLWLYHLDATREVMAGLLSYPYDFGIYDLWMHASSLAPLAADGAAILRKQERDLRELLPHVTRTLEIAGQTVPAANLPMTLASEAGHILARTAPFAAVYSDGPRGRKISLRSSACGADVGAIAAIYGGGGHRHAAGFTVPMAAVQALESGSLLPAMPTASDLA